MRFENFRGSYSTKLGYKNRHILAIFDTGATTTTINIFSLNELLGYSDDSLYRMVCSWRKKYSLNDVAYTASGEIVDLVNAFLNNIILDKYTFGNFYFRINITDMSWIKNDIITSDGRKIEPIPHILIGQDIIKSSIFHGNQNEIEITDFDNNKYEELCVEKLKNPIRLFYNQELFPRE